MTTSKVISSRTGKVVKLSSDKTIVVLVERSMKHFTGKVIRMHQKFLVHDEHNKAKLDSIVKIREGRKVSKNKSWHLAELLSTSGDI